MKPAPPILIDTPRFRARSVRPTDASQSIADWFADPARVGPLNLPPRRLTLPELRSFFAGFDNRSRMLAVLIDRRTERITGLVHVEISLLHRHARVAFLNGPNDIAARRALVAISQPFLADLFRRAGAEKLASYILTDNTAMCGLLDRLGFRREGLLRSQVRTPSGTRLDQIVFGLLPGELRAPHRAARG
jgi:RimJ/RimL family protein N-acetyltransferase